MGWATRWKHVALSIDHRTCFRFLVTSCLRHNTLGWCLALASDRAMWSESILSSQRMRKRKEPDDATRCEARSLKEVEEKTSVWATLKCTRYHVCQDNLRWWRFQKVSAFSGSENIGLKNELHKWIQDFRDRSAIFEWWARELARHFTFRLPMRAS